LAKAETIDAEKNALYGKDNRKTPLPEGLKQSRLMKIQEAKKALEAQALAEAEAKQTEYEAKKTADDSKTGRRGRLPKPPSKKPNSKSPRNFTDPESRIMPASGSNYFIQGGSLLSIEKFCIRIFIVNYMFGILPQWKYYLKWSDRRVIFSWLEV
jgi:hypothetical protein